MNARDAVAYRLALSEGFLGEAEQDVELERWRSCVDNAQLAVENAGKAVLALFGVAPKTHDPARNIAVMLRGGQFPEEVRARLTGMLPDLLALGTSEHFLTDYGDETRHALPWELFDEASAQEALAAARRSVAAAREVVVALRGTPTDLAPDDRSNPKNEGAAELATPAEEAESGRSLPEGNIPGG